MGFRYRKRLKICKGLYLNFGKKGFSSISAKLGKVTVNSKGRTTVNIGHGLSYTTDLKEEKKEKEERRAEGQRNLIQFPRKNEGTVKRFVKCRKKVPTKYPVIILLCVVGTFLYIPLGLIAISVLLWVLYKVVKFGLTD